MRFWRVVWNGGRSWTDIEGDYDCDQFIAWMRSLGRPCGAVLVVLDDPNEYNPTRLS